MFKNARFAAATVVFAILAVPALAQDAPSAGTVIARVGGTEITLGSAIALRAQLPQQFAQVPDATLFPAIVQQLIEQELLAQSQANHLNARDQVMLQNETRNFLANAALMRAATAAVTDDSISAAYASFAAHYAEGDPVTEYHAAHILVNTEEEVQQVTAALAGGRPFAEVAQEFSIDGSAQNGGDLGWFGPDMMIPDFQAAVAALQPGEVSAPLQTRFGWHVINLLETRSAAVPALDAVRDDLVEQIQREAARGLIESLTAAASVENLSEGMDPALLSQTTLLDD